MKQDDKINQVIIAANDDYRTGKKESKLTDQEYDFLLEKTSDLRLKNAIGIKVERNKTKLPVPMGSLNKIKEGKEISSWLESKSIHSNSKFIVTPKYDGLAMLLEYENGQLKKAFTRGNGTIGQDITEKIKVCPIADIQIENLTGYIVGEVILDKETFSKHFSNDKNARSVLAGIIGRKTIQKELKHISIKAFSVIGMNFSSSEEELKFLNLHMNKHFAGEVPFSIIPACEATPEALEHFKALEEKYECDGLVIKINSSQQQKEIGHETNSLNPAFARAWKPESTNGRQTVVTGIRWQPSKLGVLAPVVQIEPVEIDGNIISNVTASNARNVKENQIGKGAILTIIRSGDVIPKITKVIIGSDEPLPNSCPSCNNDVSWDKNEVHLVCSNEDCSSRRISAICSFFEKLEVDGVGEGVVTQLFEQGKDSVEKILKMTPESMLELEGFQMTKAKGIHDSIKSKLSAIPLEKIQAASNLFPGLGKRKLALLKEFDSSDKIPSQGDIIAIEGFSDTLAKRYLDNIENFWKWIEKLPITIEKSTPKETGGALEGKTFVMTGFRSPQMQEVIEGMGGKIGSSISSKTHALIIKSKGSGSSKEVKAEKLGVEIYSREEMEKTLGI